VGKTSTNYTYKAQVLDIIDGDTIWLMINLGFGAFHRRKVRFRGINTAPVETEEGVRAKDFVISQLTPCKFIAVKTYWRDKYDRYLVDVFYDCNEGDFESVVQNGAFLNQVLLDKKHAVRY